MTGLAAIVAGFLIAWFVTGRLCDPRSRFHLLDRPNERSLHVRPTPRSGGLGILAGLLAGCGWLMWREGMPEGFVAVSLGLLVAALISMWDDFGHLPARVRLAAHLFAALSLLSGGLWMPSLEVPGFAEPFRWGYWGWPLCLVYVIWMMNLYNFMDGMDGFAGGMAAWGFAFLGLFAWNADHPFYASMAWVVTAASLGFLWFNFPPAKIFMGDVGAVPLGYLKAAFALWGVREGIFPFWVPVLLFSPFIVDATVTLMRRASRGEKVWEAHRSHFYQRLVQLGWGHRRTVLAEYGLMVLAGISALFQARLPAGGVQGLAVWSWCLVYAGLAYQVSRLERSRESLRL
ncbi:MAG: glycosyltransferase family 4 protein [Magnetococcales bacterium]|nr:glycosyltransferase family 4 protein [Magnetococcales bacterium]